MDQMNRDYSDILHHPHHVSQKHPHLSKESRAAQFSPFAALTGYEDLIEETARTTEQRVELDESKREELDRKLGWLLSEGRGHSARFTFFQEDPSKEGGEYVTVGADAHRAEDLGKGIREALDLLKACGFEYVTYFEKRKPVCVRVD